MLRGLLLALTLLASGCGAIPEDDVQRSAWATQANDICAELKRVLVGLGPPTTEEERHALVRLALRADHAALAELRRLVPPLGEATNVSRFLDLFETHDRLALLAVAADERGDERTERDRWEEFVAVAARADALARDLGADECAAPSDEAGR